MPFVRFCVLKRVGARTGVFVCGLGRPLGSAMSCITQKTAGTSHVSAFLTFPFAPRQQVTVCLLCVLGNIVFTIE